MENWQNIGVWGRGKTGAKVLELLPYPPKVLFHRDNPPTLEQLSSLDGLIVFVPGPVFEEHLDLCLKARIPLVIGATGLTWPAELDKKLQAQKNSWIFASNFSLGMNLTHAMINTMSKAQVLWDNALFEITETHHTKKLDAPSGTALSWKEWLGHDAPIKSVREGDVVGIHELNLLAPFETITIKHQAHDRKVFAKGALWALDRLINKNNVPHGLVDFQTLTLKELV